MQSQDINCPSVTEGTIVQCLPFSDTQIEAAPLEHKPGRGKSVKRDFLRFTSSPLAFTCSPANKAHLCLWMCCYQICRV